MKITKHLALLVFPLILIACGGGGGGGGSGSGSNNGGGNGSEKYSISTDVQTLTFFSQRSNNNTAPMTAQTVTITFKGDGVILGHPPGVPEATNIIATLSDQGAGTMKLTIQPRTQLNEFPQTYSTTYRLVTGKSDGSNTTYTDIKVSVELADNLDIVAEGSLAVGLTPDRKFQSSPKMAIVSSSNWKLSADASWVRFSKVQGTGTNNDVKITVDADKIGQGDQTTKITVSDPSGKVTTTKTLSVLVDDTRYWFEQAGIAFSLFNGENQSQKIVAIGSNNSLENISVESDAPWLTLNRHENKLTLTANRTNLAAGMHYAKVNIKQSGKILSVQPLQVGLYVSNDTLPGDILADLQYSFIGFWLYSDPIRPYIYILTADLKKLIAYNIYTGEKNFESDSPEQFDVRQLTNGNHMEQGITAEGGYIYIQDFLPTQSVYHRFDLQTRTWADDISATDGKNLTHLINGVSVGYAELNGKLINAATGDSLNIDNSCNTAKDLWTSQVRNGSAYNYGKSAATTNDIGIADYVAGQSVVMQRTNAISCNDKHALKYADQRYKVYVGYAGATSNGRSTIIFDALYNYDEQSGFSEVLLKQPTDFHFASDSINVTKSVADGAGHSFVARSAFTGSAYEPDYVTQYDDTGKALKTVKQAERTGGEVSNMIISGDGRRLIIEHAAYDMSGGRFRSTNIQ